jgi:hypothetical protein
MYVVSRFFAIDYIAVGPQGAIVEEGGGTSSPCALAEDSRGAQAFVCNGSFPSSD